MLQRGIDGQYQSILYWCLQGNVGDQGDVGDPGKQGAKVNNIVEITVTALYFTLKAKPTISKNISAKYDILHTATMCDNQVTLDTLV